jgi:hypothetical protein
MPKKLSIIFTLLTLTSLGVMAQNNFQPYSQFGLGEIDDGFYNRTSGMGETGIAYRSNRFLINNNPASFSALTNQYFTMEMSLRGTYINYAGQPVAPASTESGDITFRRLVLGIKAAKFWGTSIGLVPFATQNYEFNVPYYVLGSNQVVANQYYTGHGSVNKAYWAHSFEFFHHLSLGVEAAYIFGDLNQKNILQNPITGASEASTQNDIYLQNIRMTYGMQLYGHVGKHWDYVLGGVYQQKAALLASPNKTVGTGTDTATSTGGGLYNAQAPDYYMYLPNSYGGGISITHNHHYTWVADYRYQDWNGVQRQNTYPGQDYNVISSERASLGFEVSKRKIFYNNLVELGYFQSGVYYGKNYLQINGTQIKDMGVTVGFGVNSLKTPLAYNIILNYGIKGTTSNNLIRENYINVSFVLNYGTIWYTKGRKFD